MFDFKFLLFPIDSFKKIIKNILKISIKIFPVLKKLLKVCKK